MWETVSDAGTHLGAGPVGVDALEEVAIAAVEEAGRA